MAWLTEHPERFAGLTEADDIKALLAALHARAEFDQQSGELVITLPGNIDA
jgi:hypothetical protein